MPRDWIFQSNPHRYDLIEAAASGFASDWSMNQHRDKVGIGDRVFFYQSGARAGVYVVGQVLSEVKEAVKEDDFGRWKVDIRYDFLVDPPLLRNEILADALLAETAPFQGRQGTNYPISRAAADRLMQIIGQRLQPVAIHRETSPSDSWAQLIRWATKFHASPDYAALEIEYKLEIARNVKRVRESITENGDGWIEDLKNAFKSPPNNLTSWRTNEPFLRWCRDNQSEALLALSELWRPEKDPLSALELFARRVPTTVATGLGTRLRMLSFFLLGVDATEFPTYRDELYDTLYKLVGYPPPDRKSGEVGLYRHALAFLDEFRSRARDAGLDLVNRLDADAAGYMIAATDAEPLPEWTEEERAAFMRFVGRGRRPPPDPAAATIDGESVASDATMAALARGLLVPAAFLEEIVELLQDKGQVVFSGPPGTGKTYIAQKLAEHLCGDPSHVKLVQFHPSYAYEDFVEGFRPTREAAGEFALSYGPLRKLAKTALADPQGRYILIIDEINRGNVARVFGELYFLLDYRGREITLQYSDDKFQLPSNLWFHRNNEHGRSQHWTARCRTAATVLLRRFLASRTAHPRHARPLARSGAC